MKKITLFLLAAGTSAATFSQTWEHNYGGSNTEYCYAVIQTSDGGFAAAGYTNLNYGGGGKDVYVVKTDANGVMQWQQVIGGTGDDIGYAITQNATGEIYIAGQTTSFGVDNSEVYVIKLTSLGNILWTNHYGGFNTDYGKALTLTATGDVIVAGGTSSFGAGNTDVYLIKLNPAGTLLWSKTFGTTFNDYANAIGNINDGGFIIAGLTTGSTSGRGYAIRTNSSGDSLWTKAYSLGSYSQAELFGVCVLTSQTEIVFCGKGSPSTYGYPKIVHLKADLNGTVAYTNYSTNISDVGFAITATADGGYAIAGDFENLGMRSQLTKYNSSGTREWETRFQYTSGYTGTAYGVKQLSSGGYIIGGYTKLPAGNEDFLLIKADASGNGQIYPPLAVTAAGPTSFCAPGTVSLSVQPGFSTYLWWSNGYPISNATTNTYTAYTQGSFYCVMTDNNGTYISNTMAVTVTSVPTANVTPAGPLSYCSVSNPQTLTTSSSYTITYQWFLNGSPITGATSYSYSPTGPGNYYLTATNACGNTTSNTVTVNSTTQPPDEADIYGWASVQQTCTSPSYPYPAYCPDGYLYADYYPGATYTWDFVPPDPWLTGYGNQYYPQQAGNYTVTIDNGCGSLTSAPYNVPLYTASCPEIEYESPTSGCSTTGVLLEVYNYSYSSYFQWYLDGSPIAGANNQTHLATVSGSYTCEVQVPCGSYYYYITEMTDPVPVNISATPSISVVGDSIVCSGTVTLTASPAGASYQWLRNNSYYVGNTQTINATLSGSYSCIINNSTCGETNSNSINVSIGLPSGTISVWPNYICAGSYTTLTAYPSVNAYTFQWRKDGIDIPGATSVTYNATLAGSYDCTFSNICGSATSNAVPLLVRPMPIASITPSGNFTLCPAATMTLNAYNDVGYTFQWRRNAYYYAGSGASLNVVSAGNYTVTVTLNGCTATSTADSITVGTFPVANIWPSTLPQFCGTGNVQLNANTGTGYTYQWMNNSLPIPLALQQTYSATTGGNYSVVITSAAGCSSTSPPFTVNGNVIPNLLVNASGPTSFCMGDSVQLSSSLAATSYQWSQDHVVIPAATTSSYYANQQAFYTLAITNASGCTGSATTAVMESSPNVTITVNNTSPCLGSYANMSVPSAPYTTYQWYLNSAPIAGATSNTYSTNSTSGNYSVVASAPGCSATSTFIAISFLPVPTASITAGGPTVFCSPSNVVLTAASGPGYTYQWYRNSVVLTGETTPTYTASTAGIYRVTVTGTNGCTAQSNNITVTVNQLPPANITASGSTTVCTPATVAMNANTGSGLSWQWQLNSVNIPGATLSSYVATATGIYKCIVTNMCGSVTSNSITATINQTPTATVTAGGPTTFCEGGTVTFTASTGSGYTYQWYRNYSAIVGATASVYTAALAGNYYVSIVANGCSASSSPITVTVNPLPTANIYNTTSLTVCSPATVSLHVYTGSGWTYQWRLNGVNISGATSPNYAAPASGVYDCVVSNTCGSVPSNTLTVTVNTAPVATITAGGPTAICPPQTVTLNAPTGPGYSYQWRLNTVNITGATASSYTTGTTGNYSCYIFSSCGSVLSNTISVTGGGPPASAVISASGPTTFCLPSSVTLNVTPPGYAYQWRRNSIDISGAVSSTYASSSTGTYTCYVYNSCGSVTSNAINVTVNSVPSVPGNISGSATNTCNTSLTYSIGAVAGATTYTWSPPAGASILSGQGTTTAIISFPSVFAAGTVSVTAGNTCGTSGPSSLAVVGVPASAGAITGPNSVCHNQHPVFYSVTAVPGADTYTWTVPPGAHIQQGQGTVEIRMKFGTNAGNITVTPSSSCGSAGTSVLAIAMPCRDEDEMTNNAGVIVYPNPADEIVTLKFNAARSEDVVIELLDVSGRLLAEKNYVAKEGENIASADVSSFAPGIYFISVVKEGKVSVLKIAVE